MFHKTSFEGHEGMLCTTTNNVYFYNVRFKSILEAVKLLKHMNKYLTYEPWCYRGEKGFRCLDNDTYYTYGKVFEHIDDDKDYVIAHQSINPKRR